MEVEFGSNQPVRFAKGKLMGSTGVEVRCKCGKSAGNAIMGKSAFVAYCSDCDPNKLQPAEFIYRPPNVKN